MDGSRPGAQTGEDEDPAIAAFSGLQGEVAEVVAAISALRAEVSGLGRRLERLDGAVRQGAGAGTASVPDYSPTLGAIAKELTAIGARVAAVEGKPALELTPAGFEVELARVVRGAAAAAGRCGSAQPGEAGRQSTLAARAAAVGVCNRGAWDHGGGAAVVYGGGTAAVVCGPLDRGFDDRRRPVGGRSGADAGGGPQDVGARSAAQQGVRGQLDGAVRGGHGGADYSAPSAGDAD